MTDYIKRVTIAVPESVIADANQLALCLGESAADDQTFETAQWQDDDGNLYAVASTVATDSFQTRAGQPLQAPNHAPDADVKAASRAQAMLEIGSMDTPFSAFPDRIAAIVGESDEMASGHLEALGVSILEPDDV